MILECPACKIKDVYSSDKESQKCFTCLKVFKPLPNTSCEIPTSTKIVKAPDVKRQKHYADFKIQPMEYIQANGLNWCAGNVIKYVTRYKLKNGVEDLEKAKHYLECLIEFEKTNKITL